MHLPNLSNLCSDQDCCVPELSLQNEYDTLMTNKEKNIISVRSLTAVLHLLEKETAEER